MLAIHHWEDGGMRIRSQIHKGVYFEFEGIPNYIKLSQNI